MGNETIPLTRGIPHRQTQSVQQQYSPLRRRLSAHGKKYAQYGVCFLTLLVLGNVIVTRLSSSTSLLRAPIQDEAIVGTPVFSFPGQHDLVFKLFGQPKEYTSRLFSGYLNLQNGGEVFYFFAESQSENADKDPLLLWLNGGPGASSLAGCFSENGPLLVNDDGFSLRVNEYAWNKNANFLCIESPVGVGFSYNTSSVYKSDDLSQAQDLYEALQQFFKKFPWLRANDFIISGESYGGIYVPTTAQAIVEGNLNGAPKINLKKFVVGNGVNEFSALSMVLYAYYHGLMSTSTYQKVRESCPDMQEYKPSSLFSQLEIDSACGKVYVDAISQLFINQINVYNIYGNCAGTTEENMRDLMKELLAPPSKLVHPMGNTMTMCLNSTQLDLYFNIQDVREDLHTNLWIDKWYGSALTTSTVAMMSKIAGLEAKNFENATLLDYTSTLNAEVTPIWKYLLENGIEGVIYHGDIDIVCDFIGGLWAVESMKLPRKGDRTPWHVKVDGTQQTGGFVEAFEGLTYVTVRGAGHLVPMWKPIEAKKMLDLFVLNIIEK